MPQSETPEAGPGPRRSAWPVHLLKVMVALFLFAMAALTFVDVIGRYVFSAPVPGTFESVGLLLGLVTFAALPLIKFETHDHRKVCKPPLTTVAPTTVDNRCTR